MGFYLFGLFLNSESALTSRKTASSPPLRVAGLLSKEKWVMLVTSVFRFSAQLYRGGMCSIKPGRPFMAASSSKGKGTTNAKQTLKPPLNFKCVENLCAHARKQGKVKLMPGK